MATRFSLTPALLLRAYAAGIFPMAQSADDPELFWVDPDLRGIIPLGAFHVGKRLRRTVRQGGFTIRCNQAFGATIRACAAPAPDRPNTWINPEIIALYTALFQQGFAHSVETYHEDRLVGGLYGVAIGGAFFGESMFSLKRDASKVALVHLVARLKQAGFTLLDTQFVTKHLAHFGAIEIPRDDYRRRLADAIAIPCAFQAQLDGDVVTWALEPSPAA